jgi:putative phosphoribosyl transferase
MREETARQFEEIERRRQSHCADRPSLEISGRTAIVVDDGIATGATMRVALRAVQRRDPAHLVLAVPVAPSALTPLPPVLSTDKAPEADLEPLA